MKLEWNDGYSTNLGFGRHLKGITHNRSRPDTVTVSLEEIAKVSQHMRPMALIRYMSDLTLVSNERTFIVTRS